MTVLGMDSHGNEWSSAAVLAAGMTPEELAQLVTGRVWASWVAVEPDLATVGSLAELDAKRGLASDPALGALVRLAAADGPYDQLAAIAVVHQLGGGLRRLCSRLRDLSDDIEAIAVGELWRQIRTFPWQRRTRAYAANLLLDTRAAVLRELQPDRSQDGQRRVVSVDCTSGHLDAIAAANSVEGEPGAELTDSSHEFVEVVRWARARRAISRADVELLIELLEAGYQVADSHPAPLRKGASSHAAVVRVASARGVSTKTIVRHRNRILDALRQQAQRYLAEVA